MFKFITTRPFWVNLLVIIILSVLLVLGFLQLLGLITRHGEYLTVPGVQGKNTTEAIKFLEDKGFEVVIQDSVYIDTLKMGIVLKQLPESGSTVKINRVVFLTVNRATLPMVIMPALNGKSFNYALEILKRSHLELGDTLHKPDFMQGSVLEQNFNGNIISAGTKLPWGSKVDLIVGGGLSIQELIVPDLVGMTLGEAKLIIEQNGISLAAIIADGPISDTLAAYVFKQSPNRYNEDNIPNYIKGGQLIDVWIAAEMKVVNDTISNVPVIKQKVPAQENK